ARADCANDILPSTNGSILPGDSITMEVNDPSGIADDPTVTGPAVYLFAKVVDRQGNDKGFTAAQMQSPDVLRYPGDVSALVRFPSVTGMSQPPGLAAGWHQFRCDFAYTSGGGAVPDRFCVDLKDVSPRLLDDGANTGAFSPTDVIRYFLGAKNTNGEWSFYHRTFNNGHPLYTMEGQGGSNSTTDINEAQNAACEWSVLPDAGLEVGDLGDILFVDDCDDRGGPAQLYFDWAFYNMSILDRVDRYDVMGPSSVVANSLASRVKNIQNQIIGDQSEIYQKILWNSGNLSTGLVGDGSSPNGGTGPEKSDDWALLDFFMTFHPNNPGVYLAGDDLAEEWSTL
ncbi:MAG: hypothetical protein JSW50_00910, partial [Candidatus Latescibacterota bacterium]